jgi:transposase InsO family protein
MYPIRTMCRVLGVAAAGYYAWRRRSPSPRAVAERALLRRIRTIHAVSQGTYGVPRIHAELEAEGVSVGRKRIARLMRSAGLAGVSRRRRPRTTMREPSARPAPDLVQRRFAVVSRIFCKMGHGGGGGPLWPTRSVVHRSGCLAQAAIRRASFLCSRRSSMLR